MPNGFISPTAPVMALVPSSAVVATREHVIHTQEVTTPSSPPMAAGAVTVLPNPSSGTSAHATTCSNDKDDMDSLVTEALNEATSQAVTHVV